MVYLKKSGPPISYLFFADDLILFVEAFIDQVEIINTCLGKDKMKIFFSRNVNHNCAKDISNKLGFLITSDLGKYLGICFMIPKFLNPNIFIWLRRYEIDSKVGMQKI